MTAHTYWDIIKDERVWYIVDDEETVAETYSTEDAQLIAAAPELLAAAEATLNAYIPIISWFQASPELLRAVADLRDAIANAKGE